MSVECVNNRVKNDWWQRGNHFFVGLRYMERICVANELLELSVIVLGLFGSMISISGSMQTTFSCANRLSSIESVRSAGSVPGITITTSPPDSV